eukprot:360942-Amphidinium_carterae.1
MSGEGRMVWPDGKIYEDARLPVHLSPWLRVSLERASQQGQYEDDRKSGHGKFTWCKSHAPRDAQSVKKAIL